jgi:hypothetical protein
MVGRVALVYGGAGSGAPPTPSGRPRRRLWPWLLATAGVVVVAALAVTLAVLARDDDGDTTAPTTSSDTETTEAEPEAEESASPVELEEVPDETGALRVRLPVDWDQRDTRPLDDGLPDITASTDIENFFTGYETSGIEMTGFRANSPHTATYFDPTSRVSMSGPAVVRQPIRR